MPRQCMTEAGLLLVRKAKSEHRYYENIQKLISSKATSSIKTINDFVPCKDAFIDQFAKMYREEQMKPRDKQNLIVALAQAYVAKVNGHQNTAVHTKVMNMCLAMHAHSPKTYKLLAANIPLLSERHIRRVSAKTRDAPIIYRSEKGLIDIVTNHIKIICERFNNNSMRVAVSVGIDATVLVKGVQVLHGCGILVGLARSNQWLKIEGNNKDDIKKFIDDCKDGKHGELAAEIKLAVLSFQQTPPGVSPYLILCGVPQTINENNTFATDTMATCEKAAESIGNVAVLNSSTDGVSCEVHSNFSQVCRYIMGDSNQLSIPDPNHNVKNLRYQEIGGSGEVPAVIGNYVFDSMMLKMARVARELLRIDDFASDALVLRLASHQTVSKLLCLETADIGNQVVSQILFSDNYYTGIEV